MLSFSQLGPFVLATLALVAIPGPAVAYLIARSLEEGRRVAVLSAAGVALGNLCHALLAALGVSALLASSAWGFEALRWAGAAYLIYLGIRSFLTKPRSSGQQRETKLRSQGHVLLNGMLVGLLNPKVILFLLAFLPQFADPAKGQVGLQLMILGLLFTLVGWLGDSLWAYLAGTVASKIQAKGRGADRWRYLSGLLYVVLGVTMLLVRG